MCRLGAEVLGFSRVIRVFDACIRVAGRLAHAAPRGIRAVPFFGFLFLLREVTGGMWSVKGLGF